MKTLHARISLDGDNWALMPMIPYAPWYGTIIEKEPPLASDWTGVIPKKRWIPARVPGAVQADLFAAGEIPEPYVGLNTRCCEWTSQRDYVYWKEFSIDKRHAGKAAWLRFEGVDSSCHVYLNGKRLGSHVGMFESFEFRVDGLLRFDRKNTLTIVVDQAPDIQPQCGWTSRVSLWKARFAYGWDFAPRLVPLGIWDSVSLIFTGAIRLGALQVYPELNDERTAAMVHLFAEVVPGSAAEGSFDIVAEVLDNGRVIAEHRGACSIAAGAVRVSLPIQNPKLWWPNGCGDQPMYQSRVRALSGGVVLDEAVADFGVRSFRLLPNEGAPADFRPYTAEVNGRRVYLKGWNFVPLDNLYGAVEEERYRHFVAMARHANVNILRVWGGGIIEKEVFYRLCDRAGIMVWQEFPQSSSGVESLPSTDPSFLGMVERTARDIVRRRRNHPSLVIWCGGNELTSTDGKPLDESYPTIGVLARVVHELDPQRVFLPTSPAGGEYFANPEKKGAMQDVHAYWHYLGPDKHYAFYNSIDPLLHSEFGACGAAPYPTMKRFVKSKKDLWPVDPDTNPIWRLHGLWCDRDIVQEMFGEVEDIKEFIRASQFIQAEGLRCIVEAHRRRKWHTSGTMPWQFNEPWPNLSCSPAVDYCGRPKPAYWWVRNAYAPVLVSARYDSIRIRDGKLKAELWINSSLTCECAADLSMSVVTADGRELLQRKRTVTVLAGNATSLGTTSVAVPASPAEVVCLCLRLTERKTGALLSWNDYLFSTAQGPVFGSVRQLSPARLSVTRDDSTMVIKNIALVPAFCVELRPDDDNDVRFWEGLSDNYFTLLPGEERRVSWRSATDASPAVRAWNVKKKDIVE